MKKNKKGFTIIELLIAIAILLSILFIAILSLTKASTRKKEEAYKQVEQQIITAAEDYAASNQYILKDIIDKGKDYIPLKSLISDDKLNKVTDPRTGKAMDPCTKIIFSYDTTKNSFKIERIDTDDLATGDDCEIKTPETPTKPELAIESVEVLSNNENKTGDDVWYNASDKPYTKIKIKNYDKFTNLKLYHGSNEDCSLDKAEIANHTDGEYTDEDAFKDGNNYKNSDKVMVYYCAEADDATTAKSNAKAKIDTINPTCKADVKPSGGIYNKSNPLESVTLSATDTGSGIDGVASKTFEKSELQYGTNIRYYYPFKDKAGNKVDCDTYVTYENTEDKILAATPIFRKNSSSGVPYSLGDWTNTSVYVNLENSGTATITKKEYKKDNDTTWSTLDDSGLIISKNGTTTISFRITDDAGNTKEYNNKIIKIDTEPPVCETASVSPNGPDYTYVGTKPTIKLSAHDYYGGSGLATTSPQTIPSSKIKEGKNTYSITFTDKVGNSRECSVPVSYKEEEDKVLAADLVLKKDSSSGSEYTQGTWTNTKVYANLDSTGTDTITSRKCSANGWSKYFNSEGCIISDEGVSTVEFEYCASTGCKTTSATIKIDTVKPTCSFGTWGSPISNGWYNIATGSPYVTFSASDNSGGSGIKSYSGDGSGYANPGVTTFSNTVLDNAGNEATCTYTVKYDNISPTFRISLSKNSGAYYDDGDWSYENIKANIYSIANTYSGIDTKKYSLGGGTKYNLYSDVTVSSTNTVGFEVCSVAGNCASDYAQINIDKGYPSCSIEANFSPRTNEWYNINSGAPTMSVEAENNGGSPYSYRWNTSSTVSSGTNNFSATVTNEAGRSATCMATVYYDDTRPTCTSTVKVTNEDTTPVNGWYNINTGEPQITFNVKDTLSGPSSSTVKVDSSAITEGNKTYNVQVSDNAGNTNTCATNVKYDATPPEMPYIDFADLYSQYVIQGPNDKKYYYACKVTNIIPHLGKDNVLSDSNAFGIDYMKHADGPLPWKGCTDEGSGIDKTMVRWDLDSLTGNDILPLKNGCANTKGNYKELTSYTSSCSTALKFTGANNDNVKIKYGRYCVDKAGNASKKFFMFIWPHTVGHGSSNQENTSCTANNDRDVINSSWSSSELEKLFNEWRTRRGLSQITF